MSQNSTIKFLLAYIHSFSRVIDPVMVVLASYIAYELRFQTESHTSTQPYVLLTLFTVLCVMLIFPMFNLYSSWRGQALFKQISAIVSAWFVVVTIIIIILFSLKVSSGYSRLWLGYWSVLGLFLLLLYRMSVYVYLYRLRKQGKNVKNSIIVGAGDLGVKLLNKTVDAPWVGYKVLAFFDDDTEKHGTNIHGVEVIAGIDTIESYIRQHDVDEIWIALPLRAEETVKSLLYEIRHHTINVKFIPDIFGFSLLNHSMTDVIGYPAVNISDTPMGGWNLVIKAAEDRVLGLVIFIAILPVMLVIALLIKTTSKGPVLFKQKRHGWDGRVINVYKFRTMKVHEEENGQLTQATQSDSRITPLGRILRKTSLDELPQFYNVLQGRMSIVGPRPHALQHNEIYKDQVNQYMLRHMVKPGITGWAQVNGFRGETDTLEKMQKRIEYDLYYIENWSLYFDLKIILMTLFKGFVNKNAY